MKSSFLETIKANNGVVFNIKYHQKRYEKVLNSFGIDKTCNLIDLIKPPKDGLYRCRLVFSLENQNNIEVTYHKYKKRKIESLKIVYDDKIDYSYKYSDRDEIDKLYNQRDICDDILIVKNGFITDTSISNIAFYNNTQWITPKTPLLYGTTRERLLDEKKIVESDIKVEELNGFSKIALLNAMIDFDIISNISFID